jgi:hypothetical protein
MNKLKIQMKKYRLLMTKQVHIKKTEKLANTMINDQIILE